MRSSRANRTDVLLLRTRLHFPRLEHATVKISPIEKGGSDRRFYRVWCGSETLILVKYNREREENRHYVEIAEFLSAHQIRVPQIYFHDSEEGLIWIEDLGERDLWSYRNEPWPLRRIFYHSALEQIAKLHSLPEQVVSEIEAHLPAQFDAALYRWEQNYFFENCLGRIFSVPQDELDRLAALPALTEIAERLAARPRLLVHRDFQSQNLIVRERAAYLIDFQGMRPGLAEYDIASLLYDPYVALPQNQRDELLVDYEAIRRRSGNAVAAEFREILCLCAMQRLMQALGAYGFLGLVKDNRAFLDHVPAAITSLRALLADLPGLAQLHSRLDSLR